MLRSIVKNKNTYFILGILFILIVWDFGKLSFNNDYIVPGVEETFLSLFKLLKDSYTYVVLGHTLLRLIIAMGICIVIGLTLAILSKMFYRFKAFVSPVMTLFKTLPIAVLIILLLVMLKSNALYYIVGVVILPLIFEATINGLEAIDSHIIDEVKLLSSINFTVVRKIYLPLTLPYIFTSLLQSFGLGLKVLVMAEFISNAKHSIGYEIMLYKDHYNEMSYVYAWSIILVFFILLVDYLINLVKKCSLVYF